MANNGSGILTPNQMVDPKLTLEAQKAESLQRIAVGLDMLIGLMATTNNLELEEVGNENGATFYRWRSIGAKATEGKAEESPNSEAQVD